MFPKGWTRNIRTWWSELSSSLSKGRKFIIPLGLLVGRRAWLFGMLCFAIVGSSRIPDSSRKEVVGDDDEAGLGGNRVIGSPGGAGLRRDASDSMAVSGSGDKMSRIWMEY